MKRNTVKLHRDNPDKEPLTGNIKVTREDWLNVAMDVLVSDGVEQVKILSLGERLGVARSSFYWYFKSRQDLLDGLLEQWEQTNTAALVKHAKMPAPTITAAVCNIFHCAVNPKLFDTALDFAIRDWARRSGKVRHIVDQSEQVRLAALTAMFQRYDYSEREAKTRARVLYYMQLGYDMADLHESHQERLDNVPMYLYCFTGQQAEPNEITALQDYVQTLKKEEKK